MRTMMTAKLTPALLAACLLTSACLENEETVEVRPNGSVRVTLRAEGDIDDLTHGHSLPLNGPWQAANADTLAWLEALGPATGGAGVRTQFEAGAWRDLVGSETPEDDGIELVVAAEFHAVSDMPEFFAPVGEPYRTALLERHSTLSITSKGARRVYVFERTYGARPFWNRFDDDLIPEGVMTALEEGRRPSDAEAREFSELIREWAHTPPSMHLITSALGAVYTDGDGTLSAAAYGRALARLHTSIDTVFSAANVGAFFDALVAAQMADTSVPAKLDLEQQLRVAARTVIASTFDEEGVDPEVRNAVLERLEWNFTSHDLAQDISDEEFRLNVSMPGTIVDGNFDEREGSTASWTFEGTDLRGSARVLRVVSVLE